MNAVAIIEINVGCDLLIWTKAININRLWILLIWLKDLNIIDMNKGCEFHWYEYHPYEFEI